MEKRQEKGFTLVELLVVFALIGGLIALVINGINIARRNSRDTVRKADLQGMQLMLEEYYNTNRIYPAFASVDVSAGAADTGATITVGTNTMTTDFKGTHTYVESATSCGTLAAATNVAATVCYLRTSGQAYTLTTVLEAGGNFNLSSK